METTKIALFKGKKIRKILFQNEWWFSAIDVIEALTDSDRPRKYWSDLKKKLIKEGYYEVSEKIGQLKLRSPDGKLREADCADTESLFRSPRCFQRQFSAKDKICKKIEIKLWQDQLVLM